MSRIALALLAFAAAHALAEIELVPQRIADGVYAFVGDGGEPDAGNRGFAANSGFVVGESGVVVIDTGTSRRHGERMLAAIARVTSRPVVLVVNTHATQEFIFGNGAFADRGIPILAHRETVTLMRARCAHCLENLRPALGAELAGTVLVLPNREVAGDTRIEAGGRRLELVHPGWAATPGDLAVVDTETGTLFAGGLVASQRIPEIRDCDFEAWLRALERLSALSPRRVVPGFGPPAGPEAIDATAAYLRDLDARVQALYARSGSLLDALDQAGLPAYERWTLYAGLHRRNAQHRYLQLETRDLGGDPRSVARPR
jgi:glyoxylase-like metal-dependent hydrolase (beta-lactamase superfamily II)